MFLMFVCVHGFCFAQRQFAQWPRTMTSLGLVYPGGPRLRRMQNMFSEGCSLHSDFSGIQAHEHCYQLMQHELNHIGMPLTPAWLQMRSACENFAPARACIEQGTARPKHLFTSVFDRLPLCVRRKLNENRPSESDDEYEWGEGLARAGTIMRKSASKGHFGSLKSPCAFHPEKVNGCYVFDRRSSVLRIAIASPMCSPWARRGTRRGHSHPATESHVAWETWVTSQDYDIVHLEQVDAYPFKDFSDAMGDKYIIPHIIAAPTIVGWPVYGSRLLAAAINQERWIWCGPPTVAGVRTHFLSLFGKEVIVLSLFLV